MDNSTYAAKLVVASSYLIVGKWDIALLHFSDLVTDRIHPTATLGFLISFGNFYAIKKLMDLQPAFAYLFTKEAIGNPSPEQESYYLIAKNLQTAGLIDPAVDLVVLADKFGDFYEPAFDLAFKLWIAQRSEVELTVFRNDKKFNHTKPLFPTEAEALSYASAPKYYSEAEMNLHKRLKSLFDAYIILVNFSVFRVFKTDNLLRKLDRDNYQYFALSEIDFLIVDRVTLTALLGIELDSHYHDDNDYRRIKDVRKNNILSLGGLPLVRVRFFLRSIPDNFEQRLVYQLLRNKINFFVHDSEAKPSSLASGLRH